MNHPGLLMLREYKDCYGEYEDKLWLAEDAETGILEASGEPNKGLTVFLMGLNRRFPGVPIKLPDADAKR